MEEETKKLKEMMLTEYEKAKTAGVIRWFVIIISVTVVMFAIHVPYWYTNKKFEQAEAEIEELRLQCMHYEKDLEVMYQNQEVMLDNITVLTEVVENQEDIIDILGRELEELSNEVAILHSILEDGVVPNVLNRTRGVAFFQGHRETWYNLDMSVIVQTARNTIAGYEDAEYWIREDGCKMLGNYIMVAADQEVHPYGSIVQTSLGEGIVVDTGTFRFFDHNQLDIAVDWRG